MTTENTKKVNYVGKGTACGFEKKSVRISFKWEDLKNLKKSDFEGEKYLTLVVIPRKEKDQYGRTHSVIEHVPQVKKAVATT